MASFLYDNAKKLLMNGGLDLDTHDIRIALVMSNTTADTEDTKTTISGGTGFTTLDEMDGAGYARVALTTEAVTDSGTYGKFDADDVTFTSVSAGTRSVTGALIFRFITNDTDNVPIAYIDFGGDFAANGSNIVITWSATGIINLT